ncbi:MAG: DNA gyrase inhibitor YacG [Deltaproteobacteria bacterium]|nr:DNA gyrase inhibitor YacG [Deltaproteobacteria bacterium]
MATSQPRRSCPCPTCSKAVMEPLPERATESSFPFCSQRCRGVDLAKWLDGGYRLDDDEPSYWPVD